MPPIRRQGGGNETLRRCLPYLHPHNHGALVRLVHFPTCHKAEHRPGSGVEYARRTSSFMLCSGLRIVDSSSIQTVEHHVEAENAPNVQNMNQRPFRGWYAIVATAATRVLNVSHLCSTCSATTHRPPLEPCIATTRLPPLNEGFIRATTLRCVHSRALLRQRKPKYTMLGSCQSIIPPLVPMRGPTMSSASEQWAYIE